MRLKIFSTPKLIFFLISFVLRPSLSVSLFHVRLKINLIFSFTKKSSRKLKNKFSFIQLLLCVLICSSIFLISFFLSFRQKKANLISLYSTMKKKWREKFIFFFVSSLTSKNKRKKLFEWFECKCWRFSRLFTQNVFSLRMLSIFWHIIFWYAFDVFKN